MRISPVATLCLVVVTALTVGACSKKKIRQPTVLSEIVNPAVRPHDAWTASAGSGSGKFFSELSPALEVDALYVASLNGHVYAYATDTGKTLWQINTKARVAAGPSVAGDRLLLGTLDGEVIALKRADGSELWRAPLSSEALGPPVSDGKVVVARTVDGRIYGLAADTGERLWTFDRTVPALVLRGLSRPLLGPGSALVGMDNGRLVSLRVADGQVQWEQAISVPSGRTELDRLVDIDADMLEGADCVYVASFGGEVVCLDPSNGQAGWRRGVKSYNSMALGNGQLYVSDESGVVWALDAKSGAAAWKQEGLLYRHLSPPAFFNGYVVVGDFEGYLHWLDPTDGKIVGRSRAGSAPIVAQPVASEKLLYVLSKNGRLAALSLDKK